MRGPSVWVPPFVQTHRSNASGAAGRRAAGNGLGMRVMLVMTPIELAKSVTGPEFPVRPLRARAGLR